MVDTQAESGVVSTLVYHPEFILHSEYLKANHFFNKDNGCIYWAIAELYKKGIDNIDAFNISNMLESNTAVMKTIEKYNLPSIQEYIDLCGEAARNTLEEYTMLARKVVEYAYKRDLHRALSETERLCLDVNTDMNALSTKVYDKINVLSERYIANQEINTFGEVVDDLWGEVCSRRTENGVYGIPSKFPTVMKYFTYEPGELVLIQGRYKQGKSIFLLNEAMYQLRQGLPTLVVDTEMSDRLYLERVLANLTGLSMKDIKRGTYDKEGEIKIQKAIEWMKKQPFVHIYKPDMTDEELYTIVRVLQYKIGLKFVVYDYLKSDLTSSSDNYNFLGAKCNYLKNMIAGELQIPVLSASQLNRQGDVSDSDKMNRYCSTACKWFIKSTEMIAQDGIECGNAGLKVYVNRNGEQSEEYIDFNLCGDNMRIVEAKQHAPDINFPFQADTNDEKEIEQ
jgi:replicative DNA helicase